MELNLKTGFSVSAEFIAAKFELEFCYCFNRVAVDSQISSRLFLKVKIELLIGNAVSKSEPSKAANTVVFVSLRCGIRHDFRQESQWRLISVQLR